MAKLKKEDICLQIEHVFGFHNARRNEILMNKEDRKKLYKLLRRKHKFLVMSRYWSWRKIEKKLKSEKHPLNLSEEIDAEIMKLIWGTDDLIEIGLQTGLLEEHPNKTKAKEKKKTKKEMLDFFDGKSKKKGKKRGKSR